MQEEAAEEDPEMDEAIAQEAEIGDADDNFDEDDKSVGSFGSSETENIIRTSLVV